MFFSEKLPLSSLLIRWFRKPLQRRYEIKTFWFYWLIKGIANKITFRINRFVFGKRAFLSKQFQGLRIIRAIIRTITSQFFLGLGIIILLELIPHYFPLNLSRIIDVFAGNYLGIAKTVFKTENIPAILRSYAQIAAVVLGLYFAGISAVLSTVYANVPDDVREKLINEKFGNFYIKLVALFGGVALILILMQIIGFVPNKLNMVFVSSLGIIALLGFVALGLRTFAFFNPIHLANDISREILRWVEAATSKGFRFAYVTFQNHYRIRAESSVNTSINIIKLAVPERHLQGEPLNKLAEILFGVIWAYSFSKNRIPSNSLWFKRKLEFPKWLTASYEEIDIALKTSTTIRGREVPDLFWLESIIKEGIAGINNAHLKNGDFRNSTGFFVNLCYYDRLIAKNYGYKEAFMIWEPLNPKNMVLKNGGLYDQEALYRENNVFKYKLAAINSYWTGFVNIILGFFDSIKREEVIGFAKNISKIDWKKEGAIYETYVPRDVLKELEPLKTLIGNEILIEKKVITAPWYVNQLALRGFIKYFDGGLESLIKTIEERLIPDCENYAENKKLVFAADLLQTGLEACAKLKSHIEEVKPVLKNIMALKLVEDLTPRADLKLTEYEERIKEARRILVTKLGQYTLGLYKIDLGTNLPDYFGQNYSYLAHECYLAMATENLDLYRELFPLFFNISLIAYEELRENLKQQENITRFGFMVQPLQDLLSLSGYSIIYTELYNKNFYEITRKTWEKYLEISTYEKNFIHLIHYVTTQKYVSFQIFPREILRTAWDQDLSRRVEELGIQYDSYSDTLFLEGNREITATPILRGVVRRVKTGLFDPRIVFGALFLKKYFDKYSKELTWEFDYLLKTVEEETDKDSGLDNEAASNSA